MWAKGVPKRWGMHAGVKWACQQQLAAPVCSPLSCSCIFFFFSFFKVWQVKRMLNYHHIHLCRHTLIGYCRCCFCWAERTTEEGRKDTSCALTSTNNYGAIDTILTLSSMFVLSFFYGARDPQKEIEQKQQSERRTVTKCRKQKKKRDTQYLPWSYSVV